MNIIKRFKIYKMKRKARKLANEIFNIELNYNDDDFARILHPEIGMKEDQIKDCIDWLEKNDPNFGSELTMNIIKRFKIYKMKRKARKLAKEIINIKANYVGDAGYEFARLLNADLGMKEVQFQECISWLKKNDPNFGSE